MYKPKLIPRTLYYSCSNHTFFNIQCTDCIFIPANQRLYAEPLQCGQPIGCGAKCNLQPGHKGLHSYAVPNAYIRCGSIHETSDGKFFNCTLTAGHPEPHSSGIYTWPVAQVPVAPRCQASNKNNQCAYRMGHAGAHITSSGWPWADGSQKQCNCTYITLDGHAAIHCLKYMGHDGQHENGLHCWPSADSKRFQFLRGEWPDEALAAQRLKADIAERYPKQPESPAAKKLRIVAEIKERVYRTLVVEARATYGELSLSQIRDIVQAVDRRVGICLNTKDLFKKG